MTTALPVDRESVPLHLVSREPEECSRELARQVVAEPDLRGAYIPWLIHLYPELLEEIKRMAKAKKSPLLEREFDLIGLIEKVGIEKVIKQLGLKRVVDQVGVDQVLQQVTPDQLLAGLTPAQREELKRRLR